MAREATYAIASARDFRSGTQEQSYAAITGHPYLEYQACALGIYNRQGSGRIITLVDWFFRDLSAANSTSATQFLLQPCSSWVEGGGENKNTEYLVKMDKNNAALPSQVKFFENPESVSLSQGIVRIVPNLMFFNETRVLADICSFLPAGYQYGFDNSNIFHGSHNNAVQGIIIREGEGLAFTPVGGLVNQCIKYHFSITIKDTANSNTYMCSIPITPDGGRVAVLFANGSGSGKNYEVKNVEIMEIGNDAQPDQYSMELIEYLNPVSGTLSDLYSHDSTNESLIGKIDYRRECSVTIAGQSTGALISTPRMGRGVVINQGAAPFGSGTLALVFGAMNQNLFNVRNEKSVIVLREGQGIGFFKRNMSARGKAGLFVRFTVAPIATGGGVTNVAFVG